MQDLPGLTNEMQDSRRTPPWLLALLGLESAQEGQEFDLSGRSYALREGLIRDEGLVSDAQAQTSDTFGFKWHQRETFESDASLDRMRSWLLERYGDVAAAPWWEEYGERPVMLDAGCGAAMSTLALFSDALNRLNYLGVDVSTAVDVGAARFEEKGLDGAFMQADIATLPLPENSVDVVYSEGVMHHTDSTEATLKALARHLRPGGRFMFYVYRRKGPIREFTDDYLRERLRDMEPSDAWKALEPLTRLGQYLGDLDIEIDVPEEVDLLGIPAGPINLQRLFYWHVFKAYHHPDLSFDELNHINYDWYAPLNAHRQSPDEVRRWCEEASLSIERERVEDAGITVIARKNGAS